MSRNVAVKRPIVIKKYITNYTTNNYITNNDNRATNITYNVRTTDKKPASNWIDEKTKLPTTNVANVYWDKASGKWMVQVVDTETRKLTTVGRFPHEKWHDAVRLREEAQKTEGTRGPGELEFTEDGEAVAACGHCRKTFGLASFAPEPCMHKKKFAEFKEACVGLGSDDAEVAAEAEAVLAVMPANVKDNEALRTSSCRRCRDAAHKSFVEGPESAVARWRDAWIEIRKHMAKRGCRDCGETRVECLECEHVDRKGKPEGCRSILQYDWFARKYGKVEGPKEMWKAYRSEHVVVLCRCCHLRQPTHNSALGADSSTLEEGSKKKRQREYVEVKTEHNNKRKREFVNVKEGRELPPGQCYYCEGEYVCDEGYEIAFQWMHRCEETKHFGISKLVANRVSPKTAIPLMNAEIDGTNGSGGCNLGCANCHHFYDTLPSLKEGTAAWDALMAQPVRKHV